MAPSSSSSQGRTIIGGASRTDVDAYAQRVFQEEAEAGSEPDSSLGPYVTSVLRSTDPQTPLVQLSEYDNMIELIQEHCWVDSSKAASILEKITAAVRTSHVPVLHNQQEQQQPIEVADNTITPRAASMIPGDLWGAMDETSPSLPTNNNYKGTSYGHQQRLDSEDAFPPLGVAGTTEYQSNHPPYHPTQNDHHQHHQAPQEYQQAPVPEDTADAYQMEQAFESSVEILLSMNPDIAEDAARQALQLVQGDANWGQYLVDVALTAPPVCRHLLNDGCYRRDCQFSHDIDGHTCVFWLRGRCGKGPACPFRHGFDEKALEAVLPPAENATTPYSTAEDPPLPSAGSTATAHGSSNNATGSNIWGRTSSTSFAQVASQGGRPSTNLSSLASASSQKSTSSSKQHAKNTKKVDIPQDLWHAHENRDSSVFYIADPLERYEAVASTVQRKNVIDLHFQSTKTFGAVLETILPQKLYCHAEVWIVTGTGHHVGTKTHQKGGGTLENAVISWLTDSGYTFFRGRDRNGLGGALLVQR